MDKKLLAQVANRDQTTRALFRHFRERKRPPEGVMDLRRVRYALKDEDNIEVVQEQLNSNFRELEKLGLGKLIIDKQGIPRFHWKVDMKEISDGVIDEVMPEALHVIAQHPHPPIKHESSDLVVMLGPNRRAVLSIPHKLTKEEADFICQTISERIR